MGNLLALPSPTFHQILHPELLHHAERISWREHRKRLTAPARAFNFRWGCNASLGSTLGAHGSQVSPVASNAHHCS